MALVNQDLVLDVVPGPIPPILHLTEYDENMEVVVTLMRRGQPFQIPTGTTVKIEGTLKGHPFSEDGTPSGNTVTFIVSESMTAFAGRAWTKIKLTQNSKPVSTCGFWLDCDRAGVEADAIIQSSGFQDQVNQGVAEVFGVSSPPSTADDCKVLGIRDSEWKPLIPYAVPIIYTSGVLRSPFTSGELTAETIANIYWQAPYKDKHILFAWDSDGYVYELKQVVTFGTKRVVFHRYDGARETTLTLTESSTSVVKKTIGGVYHVDGTTVKDENNVAVSGQEIIDNFTSTGILPILKRGEAYYHLDAVASNGIRFTLANIAEFIFIPKGSSTPDYE